MKKLIRLTENDLHNIVRKAVSRVIKENILNKRNLREARTHLGYLERNKPLYQDSLFEEMKKKVERNLRRAGLNLPFAVRNYADWNVAVDIPISAIKSYSDELVDMYNNDITAANKDVVGGRFGGSYDTSFQGLSRLYGDDYINGGYDPEYIDAYYANKYPDSSLNRFYKKLKDSPKTKWLSKSSNPNLEWYYTRHMPNKRKEYDDLREEVLSIKSIIESAGYKVRISNEDFFDRWDDENDDYSMQKFVRFVLSSDELSKYRDDQYRTPEHTADFERENAAERAAERAYEDDWIRRNG